MKFNKWTLGLAALGVVSLASAARADEKVSSLQTALSNTTISGSVSASMNWDITPGGGDQTGDIGGKPGSPTAFIPFQSGKQDGFNLDVVRLTIAKPEDESPWASGYQVDLMMGPDANGYNPSVNSYGSSDFGIKQAYVSLRTPVGNGIDWKFGVFDTIIGYEVTDAASDPNYTRSYGYAIEPTEHTGVLATYKINDQFSVSAGVANTLSAGINDRNTESGYANGQGSDWHKTWMGSVTYTAPSSWGWAAGSSLYAGIVYGFGGGGSTYQDGNQVNYYAGATLNTPWKQFTGGVAFDYAQNISGVDGLTFADIGGGVNNGDAMSIGLYGTYKATDKLSFNGRAEYLYFQENRFDHYAGSGDGFEVTATVEYDLWANVLTRVEARWDRLTSDQNILAHDDAVGLYANIIYKF
jgi:hypothetical protein